MRFEEVTITPELAKEWLATSAGNPRWRGKVVSRYRVDAIKRDIMAGNWNPGNGTIAFDERRRLIDGHHRLTAIAECGVPVRSWICVGVSDLGQRHIDDNAVRTASQILKADKKVAAIANLHIKMLCASPTAQATVEQIAAFIHENDSILQKLEPFTNKSGSALSGRAYAAHAAFCAVSCGVDVQRLARFETCLNTGFIDSSSEAAAVALRNQLLSQKPHNHNERIQADMNAQGAIRDFMAGRSRKMRYQEKSAYYFDKMYG